MSATVHQITDGLASVLIHDVSNGTNIGEVTAASADEGRRLYIGNLAYATTEGELREFFKDYTVEATSIPVNPRTNRPVGYAFVDLATAHEASAAMKELSGKEILQRKVSVQLARKPESTDERAEGAVSGGEGVNGNEGRKRGFRGRGRGRGRAHGGHAELGERATENGHAEAPTNVPAQVDPLTEVTNTNGKPRARPQKQRGPPADGIPSTTKIMVANLPYDLPEEKLLEIFATYEPVSAKIALRPIPRFMIKKLQARNERRKGRGFGFVTLASEDLQKKAVEEMNGKEIEGREIAVKVAIDSPGKQDSMDFAAQKFEEANKNAASVDKYGNTAPEEESAVAPSGENAAIAA